MHLFCSEHLIFQKFRPWPCSGIPSHSLRFGDLQSNFRKTDIKVIQLHLLRIDLPSKTRYKHTTAHTSLRSGAASVPKPPLRGFFPPCTKQHFLNFCLEIQAGGTKQGIPAPALSCGHSLSLPHTELSITPPSSRPLMPPCQSGPQTAHCCSWSSRCFSGKHRQGLCVPQAGMCPAQHANASEPAWEPSAASPRLPGTSKGTESHNRLSWTGPSGASSGVNGSFGDGTLTLVLSAPHPAHGAELRPHIPLTTSSSPS